MAIVTDFQKVYRHKQVDFERKLLKELSIHNIESMIAEYFDSFLKPLSIYKQTISDMCLDYAIESYLLGASYGRLGYYDGESAKSAFKKSSSRFKTLLDDLYDFWMFGFHADDLMYESLYMACEGFMYYWWTDGFEQTVRRYRLRLH
ncbi:DUF2521 family protein [Tuberibacillus sp. Marseille-P3662]|uniref:DUF2521 family protein n=1 Tax=Tuberibacillus sp. Marseille-P3662 TaxID=1965358 RepID=UPI000A1C8F29|nr:DUF2521 family protein [Tuberibacillus sp. Marseille-P3662]